MNRLDRLNSILIHLQSKKIVTAKEISERFEISIRTVYRDIRSLEQGGVPIGAEAGIGYFLPESYNLPPVMFTKNEAGALLFGMKFVDKFSDINIKQSFESALFKIKSVLKNQEKEYIEKLNNQIIVFPFGQNITQKENVLLSEINNAINEKKQVKILYNARYTNELTERFVEPTGICFYGNNWHLIAFCNSRNDYRDFRIDRIMSWKQTDYDFKNLKHIGIDEYFEKQQSLEKLHKIELLAARESLIFIEESKKYYGHFHEENFDELYVKMSFLNYDLKGFSRWVVLGGKHFKILKPVELKNLVREFVDELKQNYE